MNEEQRAIANLGCGCRIIPAHHFESATVEACFMHDLAPDMLETLGILDLLPPDLVEVWADLQDKLTEGRDDEISTDRGDGIPPALGDFTGDVRDDSGVGAVPGGGESSE